MSPLAPTVYAASLAFMLCIVSSISAGAQEAASEGTRSRSYDKRIQVHEVDIGVRPEPDEDVDNNSTRFRYNESPALDAVPISPADYYQAAPRIPRDRRKTDKNWLSISTDEEDDEPASGWGWLADEVRMKDDKQRVQDEEDADEEREDETYEDTTYSARKEATDSESYLLNDGPRKAPNEGKEITSAFTFDERETDEARDARNDARGERRRARDSLQRSSYRDGDNDAIARSRESASALYRTDTILSDIGSPLSKARDQARQNRSSISALSQPDTTSASSFSTTPQATIERSTFGTFTPQADHGFQSSISSERSVFDTSGGRAPTTVGFDARPSVLGSLDATPSATGSKLGHASSLGALGSSRGTASDSLAIPSRNNNSDSIQTMRDFQRPANSTVKTLGWD